MRNTSETAKRGTGDTATGRPGFTLVEMIVVLTILLILTMIAVAVAPRFQERNDVVRAADQFSQRLITARTIAQRDQIPTGVRLQPLAATTVSTTPVPQPLPQPPAPPVTITPANMSGITSNAILWSIQPGSILVVDPGTPITEFVRVLATSSTSFAAYFQNPHAAGFGILVLAYSQELQYIQQPDDFIVTPGNNYPPPGPPMITTPYPVRRLSPGVWVQGAMGYVWAGNFALLETPIPPPIPPPWSDFSGGFINPSGLPNYNLFPVQQGDYLEANGSGVVHRILGPPTPAPSPYPQTDYCLLQLASAFSLQPGTGPPPGPPLPMVAGPLTSQYRIIRMPRVLQGETPLDLPSKVVVDMNPKVFNPALGIIDPPLPIDPLTGNIDIVFSPSGGLTGRKPGLTDKIVLWVRDAGRDNSDPGEMYLVTIQVRTGFIAVNPVNMNSGDPYLYTRDNRASGL